MVGMAVKSKAGMINLLREGFLNFGMAKLGRYSVSNNRIQP